MAPPRVTTLDEGERGLKPIWLSFLTNWTFLLFGVQAFLGLALVIAVSSGLVCVDTCVSVAGR